VASLRGHSSIAGALQPAHSIVKDHSRSNPAQAAEFENGTSFSDIFSSSFE